MKTITQLTAELEAAEQLVRNLRQQREAALLAACPHKVGDIFTLANGNEFKVSSLAPASKGRGIWLICHYRTSAGKWSHGTKIIEQEVEG